MEAVRHTAENHLPNPQGHQRRIPRQAVTPPTPAPAPHGTLTLVTASVAAAATAAAGETTATATARRIGLRRRRGDGAGHHAGSNSDGARPRRLRTTHVKISFQYNVGSYRGVHQRMSSTLLLLSSDFSYPFSVSYLAQIDQPIPVLDLKCH